MASLVEGFSRLQGDAQEDGQARLRRLALERFRAGGFPGRRSEAWRHTDLAGALQGPLPPLLPRERGAGGRAPLDAACARACSGLEGETAARIVFVDGGFDAARSDLGCLPAGVRLRADGAPPAQEPPRDGDMLESLNLALARDGFALTAAAGTHCPGVIHFLFLTAADAPCSVHVRGRVHVGAGASLRLLESHIGLGAAPCLQTRATQCSLEREARLRHVCIGAHAAADISLSRLEAALQEDARLDCAVLDTGGRLARREHVCAFAAPRAQARVSALLLARAGEQRDIGAAMDHRAGACRSDTLVKSVLDAEARGVFHGLVRVAPGAAGSDGRQVSRALLLGEGARMNAKPELEIFNDDVECAHGSAIGELDAEALFYLRSRGIGLAEARRLLIAAFLVDVLGRVDDAALVAALQARARAWLDAGPAAQEA